MSDAEADVDTGTGLRTVTPSYLGRPDMEMNIIGWMVFAGMLVVIVPLLPFVLVAVVVIELLDALGGDETEEA